MATRIRLQRHGHKNYAFYTIVIADARAPRDGKFIERIGTYNPNTNPATVELNFERALYWVNSGAQPTDTARSIMSHEGVYLMKHLLTGVKKGAFDEAEAQKRFEAWKKDKQNGLKAIADKVAADKKATDAARLAAEKKINEEKAKALAEKKAAEAGYEIVEQKNLLSDANTIGAPAPLANTRDAVKWAFAKAEEGSISEIYRDPAERRFLTVAVTKINPVGYLDIKGAEQLLRAEVIKDKKADMLMKKLEGVKTVEEATEKGGTSQTLNSVRFPATLPVMNMEEPGLDGAIAATAVGQNAKKPFKGQNGVYFYKVVSSESDSTRTFDRRAMEADLMRQQVWIVTPTKTDAAGNPRTDRSGRPMHVNPFTSFWDVLLEKAGLTDNRYQF